MFIQSCRSTSPRHPGRWAVVWSLGALLSLSGGCIFSTQQSSDGASLSVAARDRHRGYREQVHRLFEWAVLLKPRDGTPYGRRLDLAPLIVHEVPDETQGAAHTLRFGALEEIDGGRVGVSTELPTVYVETGAISVRGSSYDTLTYRWFYSIDTPQGSFIAGKGLRIVLGADGFPIVYETASVDPSSGAAAGPRSLFLSASFELAAEAEYGPALVGRRFAAEKSVEDVPGAIVLRALEDGPLPMGPYLYVAAPSRRIITMHCRCSPSQMNEVIESVYYDLVPFERVRGPLALAPLGTDRAALDPLGALLDRPMDSVLRWPD
ncbi:MAG: hypothetical protein IH989_05925 [Planctomycetes bacterium]|nr:hypothetical protein [Planctomycetota bacterium]